MTTDLDTDSDGKVSDKISDDTGCLDSLGGFVGPLPQEQPQQHRSQPQQRGAEGRKGRAGRKEQKGEKGDKEKKEGARVDKVVMDAEIQIFVKEDGAKTFPMEVPLDAKVREVARRVLGIGSENDQDVCVTSDGKVLHVSDDLRSCGVRDGCTVQLVRRLQGGGRSKGKMLSGGKKKSLKKVRQSEQNTEEMNLQEVDTIAEMLDRGSRTGVGGWSAGMMEVMLEMEDEQMEKMLRGLRSNFTEEVGGDPQIVIGGFKKFVQEQRRRKEVQREEETGEAEKK